MTQSNTQKSPLWGLTGDLDYFLAMQESQPRDKPDHSPQKWDRRAESWERERVHGQKGEERVRSTVAYLESRELLRPEYQVADIGCGPGRFTVAFAHKVHWVTGFDLSPKMIQYGIEHARREGVDNVTLRTCDFQALNVREAGLEGAFDLVFSSLTPAIHGAAGLQKVMDMSRAYCCNITHIYHHNSVRQQLQTELFGLAPASPWGGRWFYSLFNVLLLMGYLPETSYDHQLRERRFAPGADYASMIMEHILPPDECTPENEARILKWLQAHADQDGMITETSRACYGRILWDIRVHSEPADLQETNRRND